VTLGPRSGIVLWSPASPGPLRAAIALVRRGDDTGRRQQRVQLIVHGHAIGAVAATASTAAIAKAVPAAAAAAASTVRQPLRPAANRLQQPRLQGMEADKPAASRHPPKCLVNPVETSFTEDVAAAAAAAVPAPLSVPPTPRGGAAWEIGVEPFTPAPSNKRRPPPSLTPGPISRPPPPSTAAKARSSSSSSSSTAHRAPAPFPRQERVLIEWMNHTLLPPTPAQSLPHPAQFLKVSMGERVMPHVCTPCRPPAHQKDMNPSLMFCVW
jgi:hypothetical protein